MEVTLTFGSVGVRIGGVASYCGKFIVQPDSPAGIEILEYIFSRPGTSYQVVNPTVVNDDVPITSTVPVGTFLQPGDALNVLFTWATRPTVPTNPPTFEPTSATDEILAINVVSYGPLTGLDNVLIRPPAIGSPTNPFVALLRSTPLIFDNATIGNLPAVIDIDALPTTWGTFGNDRPDIDEYIERCAPYCGELWKGWGTASFTPFFNHPGYGASVSSLVSQAMLMCLSTEDATKRRLLCQHLVQWGVDLLGAFLSGRNDAVDGGHYQGRKALIVWAGHFLELEFVDATATFGAGVFHEDEQYYTSVSPPAWVWGWPYGYKGRTEFPTNIEDPIDDWNGNTEYYLPQYFGQECCGTQLGAAVAMRIIGRNAELGTAQYGMMAQWMEGPSPANLAAMEAKYADYGNILWGTSYTSGGGPYDFGRAAWEAFGDYTPGNTGLGSIPMPDGFGTGSVASDGVGAGSGAIPMPDGLGSGTTAAPAGTVTGTGRAALPGPGTAVGSGTVTNMPTGFANAAVPMMTGSGRGDVTVTTFNLQPADGISVVIQIGNVQYKVVRATILNGGAFNDLFRGIANLIVDLFQNTTARISRVRDVYDPLEDETTTVMVSSVDALVSPPVPYKYTEVNGTSILYSDLRIFIPAQQLDPNSVDAVYDVQVRR